MEKYLLSNIERDDLKTLKTYRELGGYEAYRRCVEKGDRQAVIDEVVASGIAGRGGGWFSTGKKWGFLKPVEGKPTYLCANGSEGEPGSFKDRLLVERNPHLILEGVAIAAYALGVERAYLCVRGEFAEAAETLKEALADAKKENLLGKNILGKGFDLQIIIFRTGGNYICGEETAMLNSLEGWPAMPRQKPPFPAESGLYGCPTVINNVETLANLPHILGKGASWFQAIGHKNCPGNMLFSVSGHVKTPGVYELPIGKFTLREIIEKFGGGPREGHQIKAVIPGGGSSGFLTEKELDVIMEPAALKAIGSSLGTGAIIVMGDETNMVKITRKLANFFRDESCKNECEICKKGTTALAYHLRQLEIGEGNKENLDSLYETMDRMKEGGICGMPQIASSTIRSSLNRFTGEFEKACGGATS